MNALDALAGVLRLRPGEARPGGVVNHRPDWAGTLARGKSPTEMPALLGSLHNLCGHAHRLCSQMALRAAEHGNVQADAGAARALQGETLREHARRILLDWPGALWAATTGDATLSLRCCPALRSRDTDPLDTRLWLQRHLLGMPAADWLRGWDTEIDWLAEWSETAHGWLPVLVREARAAADWPVAAAKPLHVHSGAVSLRQLATCLREAPGDTRQPRWLDACAETGSWTRLHGAARAMPATPWQRLGARLAELVRMNLPDEPGRTGDGWLAFGALQIAPGEALGWVEMARGLLVHHVMLDGAAVPRVASYRVLAPTDWNFHADGAVAAALEYLRPAETARIAALMAAYDPCVRFEVETQAVEEEGAHA
ncbi:MAG TPA: hydrogenase maturation factor HoxV/HupK [Ideonella sp.]|uniref:hydrogenase maturation factor HoxV/HupK n=1 Tax=Ideonella sp. TaxID=1929293 RepID=UPI002D070CFB|nr:hydrogenase maturation factor HoxV/HupK [Ideonella sp.]HSI49681.1 hydrogenase maturation factor HoxV/HupK [Ideonella sp.]